MPVSLTASFKADLGSTLKLGLNPKDIESTPVPFIIFVLVLLNSQDHMKSVPAASVCESFRADDTRIWNHDPTERRSEPHQLLPAQYLQYRLHQSSPTPTSTSTLCTMITAGTDMHQLATYDFLLVFHSNYGPISYHFQDKGQYLQN